MLSVFFERFSLRTFLKRPKTYANPYKTFPMNIGKSLSIEYSGMKSVKYFSQIVANQQFIK